MKIKEATIENYLSIEKLTLLFSNFTILVGKNGSGKTSILEALYIFFRDFALTGGGVPPNLRDYCWFKRDLSKPIRISLRLELEKDDIQRILSPLPQIFRDYLLGYLLKDGLEMEICREIVNPQVGWRTKSLVWGKIPLVKEDRVITLEEFSKILTPKEPLKDFVLYFFTPQEFAGDRLLVDRSKKLAYLSNPQIDFLARAGVIEKSKETIGKNFRQWAEEQGIKIVERPPNQDEVPFLIQPITADIVNNLLAGIVGQIKGKLRFIPAARDQKFDITGLHSPIIDPSLVNAQRQLAMSLAREDELRWNTFRRWVEGFLEKRLEAHPNELLVIEEDLRLPLQYLGGGEQEVFALLWQLLDEGFIYAIEEPENHFHPEYLKKLFVFFKKISDRRQIIISTHSPLLIDKADVTNNWIVKKVGGKTIVQRVEVRESKEGTEEKVDLKSVLLELGFVPGDIFLKDFVLFVEGGTEKEAIIPIFAEKLGFQDFEDRVAVISIGGQNQLKNYLRIWTQILGYVPLEYLVILDRHSKELIHDIVKELGVEAKRFIVLERESIEDYYPPELIVEALKALGIEDITEKDIDPNKPIVKQIEKILKERGKMKKNWKIWIGHYVAEKMDKEKIPLEIQEAFNIIRKHLQLLSTGSKASHSSPSSQTT
jgi:predicted ATPase